MLRTKSNLSEKLEKVARHFIGEEYLQEDASLYIAARGSLTPYSAATFDLEKGIEDALLAESSNQKMALILGESGSGKSMFGQSLVQKLAQAYLLNKKYLPLFVSLPLLAVKQRHRIIPEILESKGFSAEEIAFLKEHQRFFIVLDAYDEIHTTENLYRENHFDEWQVKVMISCRSSYLTDKGNYKVFFMPFSGEKGQVGLLKEIYVAPFTPTEINQYIQKYVMVKKEEIEEEVTERGLDSKWMRAETYEGGIEYIPNLKQLITTPFLLRITMEVLPAVMREYENVSGQGERLQMTQATLYDKFIERWFQRQEERLMGLGMHPGPDLESSYKSFAKDLAKMMHERSRCFAKK